MGPRLAVVAMLLLPSIAGCAAPPECDSQGHEGSFGVETPPGSEGSGGWYVTVSLVARNDGTRTMRLDEVPDGELCAKVRWLIGMAEQSGNDRFARNDHGTNAKQFMDDLNLAWEARGLEGPPNYGPVTVTVGEHWWSFGAGGRV